MGSQQKNTAYDLSLFEVAPKKEESNKVIKLPKRKSKHRINPLNVIFMGLITFTSVTIISLMVHSQATLMELTNEINKTSKYLEESKSVYTQLEMKVDSQLSLMAVENYAKDVLGMRKTSPCQVEYVSLSDGDKAEIEAISRRWNFSDKLKDIFSSLR